MIESGHTFALKYPYSIFKILLKQHQIKIEENYKYHKEIISHCVRAAHYANADQFENFLKD